MRFASPETVINILQRDGFLTKNDPQNEISIDWATRFLATTDWSYFLFGNKSHGPSEALLEKYRDQVIKVLDSQQINSTS